LKETSSKSPLGERFRRRIMAPACSPRAKNVGRNVSVLSWRARKRRAAVHISRPAQVSCINTDHIEQAVSCRSMGAWGCVVGGARHQGQLSRSRARGAQRQSAASTLPYRRDFCGSQVTKHIDGIWSGNLVLQPHLQRSQVSSAIFGFRSSTV
jgi:hypothetical protein